MPELLLSPVQLVIICQHIKIEEQFLGILYGMWHRQVPGFQRVGKGPPEMGEAFWIAVTEWHHGSFNHIMGQEYKTFSISKPDAALCRWNWNS